MSGCDECQRTEAKPWPVYTVTMGGVVRCAKCLTPVETRTTVGTMAWTNGTTRTGSHAGPGGVR